MKYASNPDGHSKIESKLALCFTFIEPKFGGLKAGRKGVGAFNRTFAIFFHLKFGRACPTGNNMVSDS